MLNGVTLFADQTSGSDDVARLLIGPDGEASHVDFSVPESHHFYLAYPVEKLALSEEQRNMLIQYGWVIQDKSIEAQFRNKLDAMEMIRGLFLKYDNQQLVAYQDVVELLSASLDYVKDRARQQCISSGDPLLFKYWPCCLSRCYPEDLPQEYIAYLDSNLQVLLNVWKDVAEQVWWDACSSVSKALSISEQEASQLLWKNRTSFGVPEENIFYTPGIANPLNF